MYDYPTEQGGVFTTAFELSPYRRNDVWFCYGSGFNSIGTYSFNGVEVSIACAGDMRWYVENADGQIEVWRSGHDVDPMIETDEALDRIARLETTDISMNCWIEVYGRGEAEICDTIDEALEMAHIICVEEPLT